MLFRSSEVLGVGWDTHGHWLAAEAAEQGANFILPAAHEAAIRRRDTGKGVAPRTFQNMLSSQAMCFNVFAPLAADPELATRVLAPLVPGLTGVNALTIEHTPASDVFGDQTGRGGVDCDLRIDASLANEPAVIVVETKFVEEEFSTCGFRAPGRAARAQVVCPQDVAVGADRAACAYQGVKGYRYWERSDEYATVLDRPGCPFGGPLWQLWVNHTLAHVEAARHGAAHARFLVCAPEANDVLLRGVLDEFRGVLRRPETFGFLALDSLIERIGEVAGPSAWVEGLRGRYGGI